MKKILITGAARGLGKILGEFLSEKGHFVYGTTRHLQNVKNNKNTQFLYLDLTDLGSIDRLCNHFISTNESIDVLIHNAGIAYLDPADILDTNECQQTFDINFFGPIYLTKKILPIMRKANKGNLIFISSILSVDHWPFLGVYAASKAAIESVAFEWAILLKKWNIHVSVIRPNPLPTNMQILRSKNTNNSPYPQLSERKLEWENIENVCYIISKILQTVTPDFAYQTGPFSEKTVQRFLKKNAYQKAIKKYQNNLCS